MVAGTAPCTAENDESTQSTQKNAVALEALKRLKDVDLDANPALKKAVLKVLDSARGTPQFVEIVRDFDIQGQTPALLELALQNPDNVTGVDALRLILDREGADLVKQTLQETDAAAAVQLVQGLGNTGEKRVIPLLKPLLSDADREPQVRKEAVRALAKLKEGAQTLLNMVEADTLPRELHFTARTPLNTVPWADLRARAAELLPLPQTQSAEPLPPIQELVQREGDPDHGKEIFFNEIVSCARCHQVNGQGTDFGPDLSEIGTKLGKYGLYESILDPNAGISFGYEAWELELKNNEQAYGLIVSETRDEIALKAATGIVTRYPKDRIVSKRQQTTSIMPAGLQMAMTTQDLVDLVAYLSSLKKNAAP
jgi:putative heme-binding domain-containing protein